MTTERRQAIKSLYESWAELSESFFISYSDSNEQLQIEIVLAEKFIAACRNMIAENNQKDGVSL